MFFYLFFTFLVLERSIELYIARRNARFIKSIGGYEVGKKHYIAIVILHIAFLTTLFIEVNYRGYLPKYWLIPFIIFLMAQILRIWTISSLGKYWNTRIYIVPNAEPVTKGPYRYLRHPNYVIVMLEMITIPLIFGAYLTAIIFPLINAFILSYRIKVEEKALKELTNYNIEMFETPRFIPWKRSKA